MAGLLGTWSKVKVHNVILFLHVKGLTAVEIHCQLVEVYKAQIILWTQFWMWCSVFSNDQTDADEKQQLGFPTMSTVDDCVSCRCSY
jgi:hypothetical protein